MSILVYIALCIIFCCSLHHLYYIEKDYYQEKKAYSLHFAVGKKGHKEKERIGKRDVVVNNIDKEKRERENDRSSIYTCICQSISFSLSLFVFTFTQYTERTKLSVLIKCTYSILSIIFAAFKSHR